MLAVVRSTDDDVIQSSLAVWKSELLVMVVYGLASIALTNSETISDRLDPLRPECSFRIDISDLRRDRRVRLQRRRDE